MHKKAFPTPFVFFTILFLVAITIIGDPQYYAFLPNRHSSNTVIAATSGIASNTNSIQDLFNKVKNSVVEINVITAPNTHIFVNGTQYGPTGGGTGSGFVYNPNGIVVTNYHVVQDALKIYIRLLNGNSYKAFVLGQDPYSDIAVLQIDPSSNFYNEHIVPLSLGNSSATMVGQPVIAIGSSEGLSGTLSQGIITQTNRIQQDFTPFKFWVGDLIQTDAPIAHGNSGGPLLSTDGKVIGITERGVPSSEAFGLITTPGIGLAISSNTLHKIVPHLITNHSYKHSWIGINVADVSPFVRDYLGLTEARGVFVSSVEPNSPADLAKITNRVNFSSFIINQIDDTIVNSKAELLNYISNKQIGDNVTLKAFGPYPSIGLQNVNVTLAERPSPTDHPSPSQNLKHTGYLGSLNASSDQGSGRKSHILNL